MKHGGARTIQLHCTLKEVVSSHISSYLKIMFPLGCFQMISSLSNIPLPEFQYIWNHFPAWKSHQDILIHPNLQWQKTWVHADAVMTISRTLRAWLWLGESKSWYQGSKQTAGRKIMGMYASERRGWTVMGDSHKWETLVRVDTTTCQTNLQFHILNLWFSLWWWWVNKKEKSCLLKDDSSMSYFK